MQPALQTAHSEQRSIYAEPFAQRIIDLMLCKPCNVVSGLATRFSARNGMAALVADRLRATGSIVTVK